MFLNLNKIPNDGFEIDCNLKLEKSLYENANILDINQIHIKGRAIFDYENNLVLNLNVFILISFN